MGFFTKLFGGKSDGGDGGGLRRFIDEALPEAYVKSVKYAVSIQGGGAKITLDMLADGSDFNGFSGEDYRNLAEMESGYLLSSCLANPPVPTDFTLELVFGGGRIVTVERKSGSGTGTLTYLGQQQEISF